MIKNLWNPQEPTLSVIGTNRDPILSYLHPMAGPLSGVSTLKQVQNPISIPSSSSSRFNDHDSSDDPSLESANDDLPMYWNILTEEDKRGYLKLKREIKPLITRTVQKDKAKKFCSILYRINSYIYGNNLNYDNESISYRALVCGLLWMDDARKEACAVCTRQLSKLTTKCKSSINDYFKSLGLINVENTTDYAAKLTNSFPFLKNNCIEIRQWTIRAKNIRLPKIYENNFNIQNYPKDFTAPSTNINGNLQINNSINICNNHAFVSQTNNLQPNFNRDVNNVSYNSRISPNPERKHDVPKIINQESINQGSASFLDSFDEECFDDVDSLYTFE